MLNFIWIFIVALDHLKLLEKTRFIDKINVTFSWR